MRSTLIFFRVLFLILSLPAPGATPADLATREAGMRLLWGDPVTWERNGDIRRVALSNDVFVEQLRGEAALAHLYNLLSRRPEAFVEARRILEERGFVATNIVYAERTIRLAQTPPDGEAGKIALVQSHSEQNQDGEIVFWSWDDGRNATWEGSIYYEVYSTGAAATWDGQIDASTSQHPWVWYSKTWEREPHPVNYTPERPSLPGFRFAKMTAPETRLELAGIANWARCWRQCVVTGCTAAATACILTGPGWPKCFAVWCIGAEVGCALGCAF